MNIKTYEQALAAAHAGGMGNDEAHDFATDQATRPAIQGEPRRAPQPLGDSKHTPGPWVASATKSKFGSWEVFTQQGRYSIFDGSAPHGQAEANAKLAASAPALLEALKQIVAALTQPVQFTGSTLPATVEILRGDALFAVKAARAAIQLVEGGK